MGQTDIKVIRPQPGPQWKLLACPAQERFYGGARAGGKSYGLLLDWLAHSEKWGRYTKGIVFRRTMPEFEDLVEKSKEIFTHFGARFRQQKPCWFFRNGSSLKLRYLDKDSDADAYKGHEYTWQGYDELDAWPSPAPIDKLKSCLRSSHIPGYALRWVGAGNPGGKGHNWIKRRFIAPAPPFQIHQVIAELHGIQVPITRCFIPSRFENNKILAAQDPTYIIRITDGLPEYLRKAWAEGCWDITAGGMFDDLWSQAHVLQLFEIPASWYIDRSFDWGSSHPFSVGWWAESNGEEVTLHDGTRRSFPPGTVFRISEWYGGCSGRDNEGIKLSPDAIAAGILEREKSGNLKGLIIRPGAADSSIYARTRSDQNSIGEDMEKAGCFWQACDKSPGSRKAGAQKLRTLLENAVKAPLEKPGFYVFDTCRDWIRTVPALPRSEKDQDDVDTDTEDHAYDETRYRLLHKRAGTCSGEMY